MNSTVIGDNGKVFVGIINNGLLPLDRIKLPECFATSPGRDRSDADGIGRGHFGAPFDTAALKYGLPGVRWTQPY